MALTEQTRAGLALRVRPLGTGSAEEGLWQRYVEQAPAATVYHDIAWREIFRVAFGYHAYLLIAEDMSGKVCGVLPLFEVPGIVAGRRLVSVPFRDRGGLLFDSPDAFHGLLAKAKELGDERRCRSVQLKSTSSYPEALVRQSSLTQRNHWIHSQADLAGLDHAKLMDALGDKTRNMIRQAGRAGLRFAEGGWSTDLNDWLSLHRSSQHNQGIPSFPRAFFREIASTLGHQGKAQCFFVRDEKGTALAGCICFVGRDRLIYGYSASNAEGRDARANDLMLASLMERAIDRQLRWFDFGSDSPLQEGLLFFKRKWLARQAAIPTYHLGGGDGAVRDSSTPAYEMVRAIVRRLPELPARLMLAPMVRYLG